MPLYRAERWPKFLPLYVVGPLYQEGKVVLDKNKKGNNVVEAKALDSDTIEVYVNEPRTLIVGDALEGDRCLGELLNPKEIEITEIPTTINFIRKSIVVKREKDKLTKDGTFPLNRAHVLWHAHRRIEQ